MRTFIILLLFAILSTAPHVCAQTNTNERPSLLTRVADGGLLKFSRNRTENDRLTSLAREFVWSRWSAGQKGKVRLQHPGIDVTIFTSISIITKNGKLVVQLEVKTQGPFVWSRKHRTDLSTFIGVERVEKTTDSSSKEIPKTIPADEARNSSRYAIRLIAPNRTNDFLF